MLGNQRSSGCYSVVVNFDTEDNSRRFIAALKAEGTLPVEWTTMKGDSGSFATPAADVVAWTDGPEFSDLTPAGHLIRARQLIEIGEQQHARRELIAQASAQLAQAHVAVAAEIDRQATQGQLISGLQQSASAVEEMLGQLMPPGPARKATLHQLPTVAPEDVTSESAQRSCDKTVVFRGTPECQRPPTKRLIVRNPLTLVETTVKLCEPCVEMMERHSSQTVLSSDAIAQGVETPPATLSQVPQRSCAKSSLFTGAEGVPTCLRAATRRITVQSLVMDCEATVEVCEFCAAFIEQRPDMVVLSSEVLTQEA